MEEGGRGGDRPDARPDHLAHPEAQRRLALAGRLRATLDVAVRLAAPGDTAKVAQAAVDAMVEGFSAQLAQVWLAEPPSRLRLAASAGADLADAPGPSTIEVPTEASLVADVANTRLPVVTSDLVGPFSPALADGSPLVGAAVLPALTDDPESTGGTRLLGVVAAWFSERVPVEVADVLGDFAAVVSGALHHAELLERLSRPGSDRDARRAAREAERLRTFIDSVDAVLWEADPRTTQFSFVSRRAEQLLGYPVERWMEPGFWEDTIHPADHEYAVRYVQVAAAQGGDHEFEYRMLAADGRDVWVQELAHVELDDAGTAQRLVGVLLDITRRKRIEQALLDSRERFASLARTLQASLLPPHLPEIFGLEVAARYRPSEDGVEVVGDFYDLFDVGDDSWGVVIGDVCGKGPEAAALTALARYTVRAAAIRERRASRVLALLSQAVLSHDSGERYCTAVYARVVPTGDSLSLEVSCGGHPPPLVLRADGTVEPAGSPGTLLGLFETVELSDDVVLLGPGDAIVFFTDGATEARRHGEVLGEERLQALLATSGGAVRAEDIAARLEDGVVAFQEGGPQDDLAIVVLRVPG